VNIFLNGDRNSSESGDNIFLSTKIVMECENVVIIDNDCNNSNFEELGLDTEAELGLELDESLQDLEPLIPT
jgi:hypothetical protein